MKILICPLNGPRNIAEFTYGGQVKTMPDPRKATDREWAQYVFYEDSHIGVVREWWMHTASSFWFIAERHNQTDEVLRTYDPAELFDPVVDRSVMQASEETASRPHKDGQPPDGNP
jgi:sarcosine oxidase subunit delta